MRVLCTCLPAYGHFHPMVPVARALADAGHEVAFATAGEFCPRVNKSGFTAFPAGLSLAQARDEGQQRFPELIWPERLQWLFSIKVSCTVAAPALVDDLVPLIRRWSPDLLLHDGQEVGGPVAATVTAIPYAHLTVTSPPPILEALLLGYDMAPTWRQWGLDAPPFGGMYRYLCLDICPPSLRDPGVIDPPVTYPLRPTAFDMSGDEDLPTWVATPSPAPTVYVTLGTVYNEDERVFATVLEGLRDEPVNVIVTVGGALDPGVLGPQPANVHVERYIPQSLLLPLCDVLVTHGGSGTTLGALAQGVPMLILPQGADHFVNAERCVAAGAARRLLAPELEPAAVRREVRALLDDASYRKAAQRVRDEIGAMPGPEEVVALLEELAARRRPLTGRGMDRLATSLAGAEPARQASAARALGLIDDPGATEALLAAVSADEEGTRASALGALALRATDHLGRKLLSKSLNGFQPFWDPRRPVDEERARRAAEALGLPTAEVCRRYEALALALPLRLAWSPPPPADPAGGGPRPGG